MKHITHSVVISIDPTSQFGAFFKHIASEITIGENGQLLHFWCSEVDASHPHYLEIVAHKPTTAEGLRYRIPHQMVLLISDPSLSEKTIGFHP